MAIPHVNLAHPEILFAVLVGLVLAIAIGTTAQRRGHESFIYFLLSILLTPIVGFLALVVAGVRPRGQIDIPERWAREADLTSEQASELARLGMQDRALRESLGRAQADAVLAQMRAQQSSASIVPLFFLIVFAIGALFFAHTRFHRTPPGSPESFDAPVSADTDAEAPHPELREETPPAPIPRTTAWTGPLVITQPVEVNARFGKVTIPVGTQVTLLAVGRTQVQIRYGADIANIPIVATNYPR